MDRDEDRRGPFVGLDAAGSDSLVLTMSDHGFAPFRQAVHLNAWLAEKGFLVYGDATSFDNIVWDETSAYAIGFGSIYVNQRDREARGAIAPGGESETVCERLAAGLGELRDPATGRNVVRRVYRNAGLYHGPLAEEGPDLVVGLAPGYRASWQTALGDAPAELLTENRNLWSGDHTIDPACVPGVFLTNGALPCPHVRQVDVAPVILGHFGVLGS